MSEKKVKDQVAKLLDCKPDEFLGFRLLDDGGASVVAPDGRKYVYAKEELLERATQPVTNEPVQDSDSSDAHASEWRASLDDSARSRMASEILEDLDDAKEPGDSIDPVEQQARKCSVCGSVEHDKRTCPERN